jgi:hypothetical protein
MATGVQVPFVNKDTTAGKRPMSGKWRVPDGTQSSKARLQPQGPEFLDSSAKSVHAHDRLHQVRTTLSSGLIRAVAQQRLHVSTVRGGAALRCTSVDAMQC